VFRKITIVWMLNKNWEENSFSSDLFYTSKPKFIHKTINSNMTIDHQLLFHILRFNHFGRIRF
jgi:hypothetical protein